MRAGPSTPSGMFSPSDKGVRSYLSVLLMMCVMLLIVGLISSDSSNKGDITGFFSVLGIVTIVIATMFCNSKGLTVGIRAQCLHRSNVVIRALWLLFIVAVPIGLMLISLIISENGSALLMLGGSILAILVMGGLLVFIKNVTDADSKTMYTPPMDTQYDDSDDDVYADVGPDPPTDGTMEGGGITVPDDAAYASSVARYGDDSDSEL